MQQVKATRLLRDAKAAGFRMPNPPLSFNIASHDTGCQATGFIKIDDQEGLLVWEGSVWYSDRYLLNDRGKVLGVQPDCEFAEPLLDCYFEECEKFLAERRLVNEKAKSAAAIKTVEDRNNLVEFYRKRLGRL